VGGVPGQARFGDWHSRTNGSWESQLFTGNYETATTTALSYWVGCFGKGILGIALTDTFGTRFLELPNHVLNTTFLQ
jgi:hypothetical protein